MRAQRVEVIGEELAIKWDDGTENFIHLRKLREHCPCAGCKGETDVLGNVYKAPKTDLSPAAFEIQRIGLVGAYAVQPVWKDGHSTGLFTFDYLKSVAGE